MGGMPYDYVVPYQEDFQAALDQLRREVFERVTRDPDFCCAAPVGEDDLRRYFGTSRPTVSQVRDSDAFWEDLERGKARFVVVYEGGQRSQIFFAGYSFD